MGWTVRVSKKAQKQIEKISKENKGIADRVAFLLKILTGGSQAASRLKNFGKLKGSKSKYHCHIKSGKPTWVVCWEVKDSEIKILEVYYVGTHEKAPY